MHAEASSVCVQSVTLSSRFLCRFGSPEPAQVPGLPPAASGNTEAATDLQRELDSIKQMLAQVCCSCLMPVFRQRQAWAASCPECVCAQSKLCTCDPEVSL